MLPNFKNTSIENIKTDAVKAVHIARAFLVRNMPIRMDTLALICCYIFFVGMIDWGVERYFLQQAVALYQQWTIAFRPEDGPVYNAPIIAYVIVLAALTGGVLGVQLFKYAPKVRLFLTSISEHVWGKILASAVLLSFLAPFQLSRTCFTVSVCGLFLRMFVDVFPTFNTQPSKTTQKQNLFIGVLLALVVLSMGWITKPWYPVSITNDYIELADKVRLQNLVGTDKQKVVILDRDQAIDCLAVAKKNVVEKTSNRANTDLDFLKQVLGNYDISIEEQSPLIQKVADKNLLVSVNKVASIYKDLCLNGQALAQFNTISDSLKVTGKWQSQAGRLLYHHAYMFVPAAHILQYGILSPIPSLYGLGNTLFHAWLMSGEPLSISRYFDTFPIAQFTGIFAIVLAVFLITRSALAIPVTCAALLIPFAWIGFENLQLAPGFSPLRYAGLAFQLASIFLVMRGQSVWRFLVFIGILIFSIIWNKEFAIIGLVGQLAALMTPQVKVGIFGRLVLVCVCCSIAIGLLMAMGTLGAGFLDTISVGLFYIATPRIDPVTFGTLCGQVIAVAAALIFLSYRFEGVERYARLCIIPVLCLMVIKYIYYYSSVHLLYVIGFILPFSLVFLDWKNQLRFLNAWGVDDVQRQKFTSIMCGLLVLVACISAIHYNSAAKLRQDKMVGVFQQESWNELGEHFFTTTPAPPIVSRMVVVKEMIRPKDFVLFLSPFDHLMSFYGNPEKYCGHFENLTNLVVNKNITQITDCISENQEVLVVYDRAIEKQCPPRSHEQFYDAQSCVSKQKLFLTMQTIMTTLQPQLVLVKEVGDLSFYRHKEKRREP